MSLADRIKKLISVFSFMRKTHGRIFSVTFITKEGSTRTLNCKVLRTPMLVRAVYPVIENNLLHRHGRSNCIRSFRALSVISMRCAGQTVKFG